MKVSLKYIKRSFSASTKNFVTCTFILKLKKIFTWPSEGIFDPMALFIAFFYNLDALFGVLYGEPTCLLEQ